MLTKADSPSYHSRPADHHLDNLLHSLAMIIARDKSHEYSLSTRKLLLARSINLSQSAESKLTIKLSLKPKLSS
ncbi:hypothetical protein, partial [Klebsiella pneumoniae]|uniref:hypothetical protein n=1 Tax=Klebsiella pneumoniae TaxID=573 RepID=UPI003F51DF46